MKTIDCEFINKRFVSEKDLLREDERFNGEVEEIALEIALNCREKPVILLSGPSGSGKTTTSAMIKKQLEACGHKTRVISLDNYFKTINPEEKASVDFESPDRMNSKLLTEHVNKIIDCVEVELPAFDFVNTKNYPSGQKFKRKKDEIVIFEGIHALNPDVININDDKTFKIYAGVRTRITCNDEIYHPKYIRLLRRIGRDLLYRGREIDETIKYFDSVERGETMYVAPFKHRADFSIDTFIAYEPKVYKKLLAYKLDKIADKNSEETVQRLVSFLNDFEEIEPSLVAKNSLIREFIGKN